MFLHVFSIVKLIAYECCSRKIVVVVVIVIIMQNNIMASREFYRMKNAYYYLLWTTKFSHISFFHYPSILMAVNICKVLVVFLSSSSSRFNSSVYAHIEIGDSFYPSQRLYGKNSKFTPISYKKIPILSKCTATRIRFFGDHFEKSIRVEDKRSRTIFMWVCWWRWWWWWWRFE